MIVLALVQVSGDQIVTLKSEVERSSKLLDQLTLQKTRAEKVRAVVLYHVSAVHEFVLSRNYKKHTCPLKAS